MNRILGLFGGVPRGTSRNDDDFSDRLNHRYTVSLIVIFSIVVSTRQYVGDPINCWVPAHFSWSWENYVNSYCWIKGTYHLPIKEYIPHEHEENKRDMISYYQWVPLILMCQALLFYLPIMFWRTLNGRTGIDLNSIVEAAEKLEDAERGDDRDKILRNMAKQMHRFLDGQGQRGLVRRCTFSLTHCVSRTFCVVCGRRFGNYLVVLYIFTKMLFVINILGQFFLLNLFLGMDFHFYGIEVIKSLAHRTDWTTRFPRITMCDFKIRQLANIQRYTVQCVLPINLFNEKIYVFLWFWLVLVGVLTCLSCFVWICRLSCMCDRRRYIKKHLRMVDKMVSSLDRELCIDFVNGYLRSDGFFVIYLLQENTNDVTVTEFISALWDYYRANPGMEIEEEEDEEEETVDPDAVEEEAEPEDVDM